ncbi:MAG: hypothetical protein KGL40_01295 [Rhodocyclaceae bacterium]|nr:hypothetical protein [Rhodocyclaceae bacterium]
MKLALFADGDVGLAICRFLLAHYQQDVAVVVAIRDGEIANLARAAGVAVVVFADEANVLQALPADIDLGLLAWWPKILKQPLLAFPRLGFINTHPSLLPWNRGKHYNFWALVEQAPFGVTLHCVDPGIDSGPIVAQQAVSYDWTDTGETLYRKAQSAMVALFEQTWPKLRSGHVDAAPQAEGQGSFHHSSELDGASRIDLDRLYSARELLNLLRARTFRPHPGCWFEDDGQRYEIAIDIRKSEQ